jgi:polyketide synthase PksN
MRQVLVLSARDDDRLRFASGRLLRHLQYVPGLALADVAYTLQIGREAMSSRLAFVVDSIDATCDILQRLCTGDGTLPPDVWRGDAHRAPAMPAPALVKGDPQRLAAHWAGGGDVDWEALHAGTRARIVALPGYPFEPRRCWLPAMDNDDYAASLARIDDGFAEQAIDAAADPVGTAHAEIASMLGLTTQQLPRDTLLARFEMPHILLPRLQRHLQARLGMALEATALNGCQSVGDVLALLHPQARRARARPRVKRP